MSTQKQEKFTVVTTPEKSRQHKPLVHIEGKLTPEQLEAIAGGAGTGSGGWGGNHNETMVSIKEIVMSPPPEKPRPQPPKVRLEGKLTEEQLEAIAGGVIPPTGNHNEIVMGIREQIKETGEGIAAQQENTDELRELTLEELAAISGGFSTGDDGEPDPNEPDG
ncbi:MAG: hypothetical protein QNJ72_03920 [Pleurocapsa sp. MO_226.B13]|nr:hypothetical protein [Pleurocapsa sp. MO_226.B13]